MPFFEQQRTARLATWQLVVAFTVTVVLVLAGVNALLALVWLAVRGLLRTDGFPHGFFAVNSAMTLLLVFGGWLVERNALAQGGAALARQCGARDLRPHQSHDEQLLQHTIEEMALAARMPVPRGMLMQNHWQINAFAAGRRAQDSVIVVTQGALQALNRAELQGLVAHELSHIAEGDTRLNTELVSMVFGLELVCNFGVSLLGRRAGWARVLVSMLALPILVVGAGGWLGGRLLVAAVSRQREFLADARAVQWTRYPEGLVGVLRKIAHQHDTPPCNTHADNAPGLFETDLIPRHQPLIQHMLLAAPAGPTNWLRAQLSAHPPIAQRIARICGER